MAGNANDDEDQTDLLLAANIKHHNCPIEVTGDGEQAAVTVPAAVLAACNHHTHTYALSYLLTCLFLLSFLVWAGGLQGTYPFQSGKQASKDARLS